MMNAILPHMNDYVEQGNLKYAFGNEIYYHRTSSYMCVCFKLLNNISSLYMV